MDRKLKDLLLKAQEIKANSRIATDDAKRLALNSHRLRAEHHRLLLINKSRRASFAKRAAAAAAG